VISRHTQELVAARERRLEARAERVRAAMLAGYRKDGPAFCVRRTEVVEHVARRLGIPVVSYQLFVEVADAATVLGWQTVCCGGRQLFRGVRNRRQSAAEALARSRANRLDAGTAQWVSQPGRVL